ncbi:MAG: AEC family transporter [Asticcacaulis sp.]|uniref:AEC family transporter n=1 Tax=Asticcacaulis sp. TaxID=1872648 RepID=UPI0039E27F22
MFTPLLTILPVFALVLAGWGARRTGVLGPHATRELNRFVVWLALPALLFDIVAHAQFHTLWQPGFIAAFSLGCFAVFVITIALRWRKPRHLADAAIDGLNAAYGNTGFIGFPLAAAVFGVSALTPTLIAAILTVCVLFGVAIILIEAGLQGEAHPLHILGKVALSLAKNPLLVAPVVALIVPLSGHALPAPADSFLKLLGGAASPCALVALGLFLAEKQPEGQTAHGITALLVGLKLIAQPALTWLACVYWLHLSATDTRLCVVLAALPTGTGPFMLAEFYHREATITSRVILASTIASLITLSVLLALPF